MRPKCSHHNILISFILLLYGQMTCEEITRFDIVFPYQQLNQTTATKSSSLTKDRTLYEIISTRVENIALRRQNGSYINKPDDLISSNAMSSAIKDATFNNHNDKLAYSSSMPRKNRSELLPMVKPNGSHQVLRRSRRDILLLYNVVSCATGCNPMHLMGYGCYCGFMGAGTPVDGIDKCCQVHDWCYDRLPCPSFMLYFIPYKWECQQASPKCYHQTLPTCGDHMCECDRLFAECLKRQPCPKKKAFCKSAPWRLIQNLLFDFGIAG